ncbi:MAG: DEAD/DEAH box helicase, partial [Saprospiraceae bacterium]
MTFKELGLNQALQEALSFMGFEKATPIQEQAIPIILSGKDLLACAQTGTGKTAAFILPILDMLTEKPKEGIKTLVIAPTRELAMQIEQQIQGFSYFAGVSSIAIYGGGSGSDFHEEKEALKNGTDIIVATPGKLISHINMGYADFSFVEYLVLDEADRMLDMGFFEDIQRIVKAL